MLTEPPCPIYHLTPASYYHAQSPQQPYQPQTFNQDGFIHCTAGTAKLIEIANLFFADWPDDLLALEIDPTQLTAPLIFEPPIPPAQAAATEASPLAIESDTLFPHIYGPLNRAAIVGWVILQRDSLGHWQMPKATADR